MIQKIFIASVITMSINLKHDKPSQIESVQIEDQNDDPNLKSLDDMLAETARDWSQYLQVDTSKHDTAIQDLSEDLMIRLDEFEQLLSMSKDETRICFFKQMPAIQEKYNELQDVFQNVDTLKKMVDRIKKDMDQLDKELTDAEATVETAPMQSFMPSLIGGAKNLIGNSAASVLIRNAITEPSQSSSTASTDSSATYEPLNIFRTEEFFEEPSN